MPWSPRRWHQFVVECPISIFQCLVNADSNVRRLFIDGRKHRASFSIKSILAFVITYVDNHVANHARNIHIAIRGHLAHDHDHAGGSRRLNSNSGIRILAITASRIASEIWSHSLSGCPSVTDSDENKVFFICSFSSISGPL